MYYFGLHIVDIAIVLVFLVALLWVGVYSARSVKHETDFYLGGRSFGKLLQFFMSFGRMTDPNGAEMITSEVFRQGVGGVWIGLQTLFITPFYWFMTTWFRRVRLVTMADLFIDRFNSRTLATSYTLFNIVMALLGLGLGNMVAFKVASAMITKPPEIWTVAERQVVEGYGQFKELKSQYEAGKLPANMKERYAELKDRNSRGELKSFVSYLRPLPFYLAYTVIVGIYITFGGLKAVALSDVLQGLLIFAFTICMIGMGLAQVGGFAGLHATVPEHMFHQFGTVATSDYAWYSILAIFVTSLIQIFGLMGNMSGAGSARNESSARFGMISGAFTKRMLIVAWAFCGLIALALFPQGLSDPDHAWGAMAHKLLLPGMMGLLMAGMLVGHMPSAGIQSISVSALLVRNVYQMLVIGRTQQHYLRVGKVAVIAVLAAGVLMSAFFSGVITLITTLITFNAFFGAVVLLMFFWRKLTARAILWSLVLWVLVIGIAPWTVPHIEALRRDPSLLRQTHERTTEVFTAATRADVAAGLAREAGQSIWKTRIIPPSSIFFDSVARVDSQVKDSPLEGVGRFNVETYLLSLLGVPLEGCNKAGLVACRWAVDGVLPFVMLISLSFVTGRARSGVGAGALREAAASTPHGGEGSISVAAAGDGRGGGDCEISAADAEQLRVDRFFARLKTPVGATPEEEERAVALTNADPHRFDHLKLFPRSNWEFTRWTRQDVFGFLACWGIVLGILGVLWLVLKIGA